MTDMRIEKNLDCCQKVHQRPLFVGDRVHSCTDRLIDRRCERFAVLPNNRQIHRDPARWLAATESQLFLGSRLMAPSTVAPTGGDWSNYSAWQASNICTYAGTSEWGSDCWGGV